jgi:Protein of unknown function (DUF3800)
LSAMPRVIACDESGSEGETLIGAADRVFVHASVDVELAQAEEVIDRMRADMRAQAPELKTKTALAARNRSNLLRAIGPLIGHSNIYLVDKYYYATVKLVELLIADAASAFGYDLATSGEGAQLAYALNSKGPTALGSQVWEALLSSFNRLIRAYTRAGAQSPSPTEFFGVLDVARNSCSDDEVSFVLDLLWRGRHLAVDQPGFEPSVLREMDPMATSLSKVARTWRLRLGDVPFEFLVDNYWGLGEETRDLIVASARAELSLAGIELPSADLRAIRLADSKLDARIQIADIFAGIGQEISRQAFDGEFDDVLQVALREAVDADGMWAIGSPLDVLSERRIPEYFDRWLSGHSR